MDKIKEKFISKAGPMAEQTKKLVKEHGDFVLGQYTIEQVYSGMKGMIGMITETSKLDAEEGIRFRGYSIPELREKLPVSKEGPEPLPEGIFEPDRSSDDGTRPAAEATCDAGGTAGVQPGEGHVRADAGGREIGRAHV